MDTVDLLGIGFASLTIFLIYLTIRLPAKYHIKYFAIPALFILGILFVEQFPNIMGLPKHGYPEKQFTLISYRTAFINSEQVIEIWINEGKTTRLYQFPYSAGLQQKLSQIMEDDKNGKYTISMFFDKDVQNIPSKSLPPKQ